MTPVFRPVSFWNSALMTLPDGVFFDLMRSVLGTVKTPFNKQNLVEELSRFIVRPDIQETMAAYINKDDRRLIAAIALLGEPAPGELESFFSGEYSYARLQIMLLNLEERLIIYRFRDTAESAGQGGHSPGQKPGQLPLRIALNPRLETILAEAAADTAMLFPSIESEGKEENRQKDEGGICNPEISGRTLAAFFAFLTSGEALIKNDGANAGGPVFRKKAAEESRRLFPRLDVEALTGGLMGLGLLVQNGECLEPDEAKLAAFKALSNRDRFVYLAGGMALHFQQEASGKAGAIWNRGVLRAAVRIIHAVLGQVEPRRVEQGRGESGPLSNTVSSPANSAANSPASSRRFPETTLYKLAELLRRKEESSWGYLGPLDPQAGLPPPPLLLKAAAAAGLFSVTEHNGERVYRFLDCSESANSDKPSIAMDSGFSCILYPEISFADALDLASYSTVEETGTTVRFTLSRESVVRGFNRSHDAESLKRLLERLSGGRVPGALTWNLGDWEKRWREVSLREGTILTLSGGRAYLAQSGPLLPLVRETLAPGVYLLSVNAAEAAEALRDAGVDIIGCPGVPSGSWGAVSQIFPSLEQLSGIPAADIPAGDDPAEGRLAAQKGRAEPPGPEAGGEDKAPAIKERFRAVLAGMTLSRQDKEELEARIERRVILTESQLKDASLRYERSEARGLDYVGKTGVVKQAIASGSLVEVSCLGEEGRTILGNPEGLDKKGGEMILSLRPREGGDIVKIPLGKISLVRRIKQSIFGET